MEKFDGVYCIKFKGKEKKCEANKGAALKLTAETLQKKMLEKL